MQYSAHSNCFTVSNFEPQVSSEEEQDEQVPPADLPDSERSGLLITSQALLHLAQDYRSRGDGESDRRARAVIEVLGYLHARLLGKGKHLVGSGPG